MILICPPCHRAFVRTQQEIADRGGVRQCRCDRCDGPLGTLEDVMGISLEAQPAGDDNAQGYSREMEPLFSSDDDATELAGPSHGPPTGQMVAPATKVATAEGHLVPRFATGAYDIEGVFEPHQLHNDATAIGVGAMTGGPANAAPAGNPNKSLGMAIGCVAMVVLGLMAVGTLGIALTLTNDSELDTDSPGGENASMKMPLEDRMRAAVDSVRGATSPAIRLGQAPQDGFVLFAAASGITHNNEHLASVSLGRTEAGAKPNSKSPFITPLAKSIDAWYTKEDPNNENDRWVVVLSDNKTPYRVVFETLYTGYDRGSRLQLAAISPTNPSAFVAQEIIPTEWPDSIDADVPDEFTPHTAAVSANLNVQSVVIFIEEGGFAVQGPGKKRSEAVRLEKVTRYPIRDLENQVLELRRKNAKISAVELSPLPNTTSYLLLRTLSAVTRAKDGVEEVEEVRFRAPRVEGRPKPKKKKKKKPAVAPKKGKKKKRKR